MRIKHFLKLKAENNQETWIIITRYNLASILYRIIDNPQPIIYFYYEDIISHIKTQKSILYTQNNSKNIYNQILQNDYEKYQLIGQSIWNQFTEQNLWNQIWNNTFYSYCLPEKNNILHRILHYATRTNDHIYIGGQIKKTFFFCEW